MTSVSSDAVLSVFQFHVIGQVCDGGEYGALDRLPIMAEDDYKAVDP